MYASLQMLNKTHTCACCLCSAIHIYQHLSSNVVISSINAESILQIVISKIKCLYVETFCRFSKFLLTVLRFCISRSQVPCQACSQTCLSDVSSGVLLCKLLLSLCVHTCLTAFRSILAFSQHDTTLCCPFCVMGLIFSSVTSVSLSKFPEMAGECFSGALFTMPTSISPPHPSFFCKSSS